MITNYLQNKLIDWLFRGQSYTPPSTHYIGLLASTKGVRSNSTAYALNDTMTVVANDGVTHLYKCSTAGTSASSQGSLFPGVEGEVITDGSAAFTEQSLVIRAGTAAEAAYTNYARQGVSASLAAFSGTHGAGTTSASSGTTGTTTNNASITWPAPGSGPTYVWAEAWYDASTSGNLLFVGPISARVLYSGDGGPVSAAGSTGQQFK